MLRCRIWQITWLGAFLYASDQEFAPVAVHLQSSLVENHVSMPRSHGWLETTDHAPIPVRAYPRRELTRNGRQSVRGHSDLNLIR